MKTTSSFKDYHNSDERIFFGDYCLSLVVPRGLVLTSDFSYLWRLIPYSAETEMPDDEPYEFSVGLVRENESSDDAWLHEGWVNTLDPWKHGNKRFSPIDKKTEIWNHEVVRFGNEASGLTGFKFKVCDPFGNGYMGQTATVATYQDTLSFHIRELVENTRFEHDSQYLSQEQLGKAVNAFFSLEGVKPFLFIGQNRYMTADRVIQFVKKMVSIAESERSPSAEAVKDYYDILIWCKSNLEASPELFDDSLWALAERNGV